MKLQYKIDEFALILIGSLIFFIGLVAINYYTNLTPTEIKNITNYTLLSKQFVLDGLEKRVSLIEIEDKIYKSLLEEKPLNIKIEIPKEEINKISKINIEFESEKNISRIYLVENKNLYISKNEYLKNEIKEKMYFIVKIEEYDLTIPFIILAITISISIIIFLIYREYPKLRDKIKIIGTSIIIALLTFFFVFGSIRVNDNVKVTVYATKDLAEKTFTFQAIPKTYNIQIVFDIGNSIRTNKLKIYLNDEIIYDSIPFNPSVRIVLNNVNLNKINSLKFETSNAYYEIKNVYIIFS